MAGGARPRRQACACGGRHARQDHRLAMLAWVLERAGGSPGFLIGGVPMDFPVSARLTRSPLFVIEADEYDTAFFDKRSKFVHYRPRTAILNNLEFDHADIFDDLAAIERQFHHFVRTVPQFGLIVVNAADEALEASAQPRRVDAGRGLRYVPARGRPAQPDSDWRLRGSLAGEAGRARTLVIAGRTQPAQCPCSRRRRAPRGRRARRRRSRRSDAFRA